MVVPAPLTETVDGLSGTPVLAFTTLHVTVHETPELNEPGTEAV
jgi:hypothetical protein